MTFDEWLSQQGGNVDVDCGCVSTETFMHWLRAAYDAGSSLVIPDGCDNTSQQFESLSKRSANE